MAETSESIPARLQPIGKIQLALFLNLEERLFGGHPSQGGYARCGDTEILQIAG